VLEPVQIHTAVVFDRNVARLHVVERYLERSEISVVSTASNPEDALRAVAELRPEVLVAEIKRASLVACLETVDNAKQLHPELRVVGLGDSDVSPVIEAAFDAGTDVYCVAAAAGHDFVCAVRQALRRSIYVASPRRRETPDVVGRPATEALEVLTKRELEILRLVGEGYSNIQLAGMLWVTEQTVKFHLSNIYRKLGVANRTEASRWAHFHGLLPEVPHRLTAV
jgi:DNA-binding NarL/FixJ family response regulator